LFPDESIDENIGFIREELVDIKRTKNEKNKTNKRIYERNRKEILDGLMEEVEKRRKE